MIKKKKKESVPAIPTISNKCNKISVIRTTDQVLGNQRQTRETDRAEKVKFECGRRTVWGFLCCLRASVSSKGDWRAEYCRHTDAARARKSVWLC